jgi:hypothetical protein
VEEELDRIRGIPGVLEPTKTQVVANPSFETGDFTSPWRFTGNGMVHSNTNSAYQSYDRTHIAKVPLTFVSSRSFRSNTDRAHGN